MCVYIILSFSLMESNFANELINSLFTCLYDIGYCEAMCFECGHSCCCNLQIWIITQCSRSYCILSLCRQHQSRENVVSPYLTCERSLEYSHTGGSAEKSPSIWQPTVSTGAGVTARICLIRENVSRQFFGSSECATESKPNWMIVNYLVVADSNVARHTRSLFCHECVALC